MKFSENHQQQSFLDNGNDEAGGDIKTSEAEYDAVGGGDSSVVRAPDS